MAQVGKTQLIADLLYGQRAVQEPVSDVLELVPADVFPQRNAGMGPEKRAEIVGGKTEDRCEVFSLCIGGAIDVLMNILKKPGNLVGVFARNC